MISRDRFELILEAIANGEALASTRNRLEVIFSKIAEKIGTSGGGGAIIDELFHDETVTVPVNGSYSKTVGGLSDYKIMIVRAVQPNSNTTITGTIPLINLPATNEIGFECDDGMFTLKVNLSTNTITGTNDYNGVWSIRSIIGVK